jgi:hypothetical protein
MNELKMKEEEEEILLLYSARGGRREDKEEQRISYAEERVRREPERYSFFFPLQVREDNERKEESREEEIRRTEK